PRSLCCSRKPCSFQEALPPVSERILKDDTEPEPELPSFSWSQTEALAECIAASNRIVRARHIRLKRNLQYAESTLRRKNASARLRNRSRSQTRQCYFRSNASLL